MINVISDLVRQDDRIVLFLCDIGVYGFSNVLKEYPDRCMNIGIFEDGTISVAAGMAIKGYIPIFYGINPFICGRGYEQLKLDFAYQGLGGNFIGAGAAYDFSKCGFSHYAPEDYTLIKSIPEFEFVCPGSPVEFENIFDFRYDNGNPTYFRLTDYSNKYEIVSEYGMAQVIKKGKQATVIAVSTMLDDVIEACKDYDVTILYYNTLLPFDEFTLYNNNPANKVLLCEPHHEGSILLNCMKALKFSSIEYISVGLPVEIMRGYGTKIERDYFYNLTQESIKSKLEKLINE